MNQITKWWFMEKGRENLLYTLISKCIQKIFLTAQPVTNILLLKCLFVAGSQSIWPFWLHKKNPPLSSLISFSHCHLFSLELEMLWFLSCIISFKESKHLNDHLCRLVFEPKLDSLCLLVLFFKALSSCSD